MPTNIWGASLKPRAGFYAKSAQLALTLLLAAVPFASQADSVWLEKGAGSTRALLGVPGQRAQPMPKWLTVRASATDAGALTVSQGAAQLDIAGLPDVQPAKPTGDVRLNLSHVDANGVLTYYQAKLGRQDTKAQSDLELVPTTPGGNTFKLVWKGQTVAATRVNVDTSAGWSRTLTPAADGTVQLETPFAGLYVLEVSARINGSAMVDGTKYEEVRHTATLSFEVVR